MSARSSFFHCGASSGMSSTVAEYAAVGTETAAATAAKLAAAPPANNCRRDPPSLVSVTSSMTAVTSPMPFSFQIRRIKPTVTTELRELRLKKHRKVNKNDLLDFHAHGE